MIDPHGDAGDVISDVPSLSVDEVETRIGARTRVRREGVRSGAPARGRAAPVQSRRVTLYRDSATILIFVLIALLAARFMFNGNETATASPTPLPSAVDVTEVPGDSGFQFSLVPSLGPPVDPSSRINATPTPVPVITPGPPTPPTNVVATRGNQAADVEWNAPFSNGGVEINKYVVTSKPGGKTCSAATGVHHCTVSGLTNGVSYTFTVTATNRVGTSPPSDPSNAVTPAAVPGKPTNVVASPRDAGAVVTWTAPANGGTTITKYTVKSSPGGKLCVVTGSPAARTCTFATGTLTNGTPYQFSVTATNSVGTGLASNLSVAVTPSAAPTAPGAPTGVSATAGNGDASVSWSPPASDGGSPITSYTVTSSPGGLTCSTATTGCTVGSLSNGTSYTFTVTATNIAGTGPASAPSSPVTPEPPPPVAAFDSSQCPTTVSTPVTFTNNSTGVIDTYDWDYGDGSGHDTTVNGSHTYTTPSPTGADWAVTLTVTGPGGSDSVTHICTVT